MIVNFDNAVGQIELESMRNGMWSEIKFYVSLIQWAILDSVISTHKRKKNYTNIQGLKQG